MNAIDTNLLVRYLVQDDPDHGKKAAAFIESAIENAEIFIGNIVLCEMVWILGSAYDYGKAHLIVALEKILQTAGFNFESKDLVGRLSKTTGIRRSIFPIA